MRERGLAVNGTTEEEEKRNIVAVPAKDLSLLKHTETPSEFHTDANEQRKPLAQQHQAQREEQSDKEEAERPFIIASALWILILWLVHIESNIDLGPGRGKV
ncbi:hypothetical protein K0M31_003899 [Melipona bicolor]|uniref:Uncharacterized protein n=1 Tax=Melipona bicolor TaxID=60889 RepID=A0AA40FXS1_9HYME|nr:hypothetical protein K0M31_003899 [Melipona bicolor]